MVAADETDSVPFLFRSGVPLLVQAGYALSLLDGYAIWLQSGRQADNLVARIGKATMAPFPQIDPRTRDQYLRLLKQYLSWCVTRYIPRARHNSTTQANIEVVFADVADVIVNRPWFPRYPPSSENTVSDKIIATKVGFSSVTSFGKRL